MFAGWGTLLHLRNARLLVQVRQMEMESMMASCCHHLFLWRLGDGSRSCSHRRKCSTKGIVPNRSGGGLMWENKDIA